MKPFLSSLLAVCVLLFAVGCRHHTIQTIPNNDIATVTELTESIPFSGELTQYHVQEDILRIECIAPGLDTYTLSVILYSLTTDNVLGCVDLGNGDWFTGWTADGFYVASLSQHTIKIYDRTCRLTETKNIPDTLGHLSFFVMNEAADTYFIGVGDTATLYLYDATSETAKNVGHMLFGYQNPLGYRDGYFYLEGEDELLRIHEDANYAQTVYCDSQHLYKFIDMGIGDRGEQFYVVPTDATSAFYLPMHALGEYPVTATSTHFATLTDGTNDTTDIVRIYDLNAKTVQTLQYHDVQSVVLFTEGVLISTYDGTSHRLYRHQTDDPHSVTFTTTAANDVSKTTHTSFATTNAIVAAHMIDVPIISQMPDYPTGCESVSAVMALRYYGESVTVDDFIDDHLPKSAYVYSKDGIYYGPSPFQYFVGNPRSKNSYGCMATVIHHALNSYFGNQERVINVTGLSLDELCAQYVSQNHPVLVWVTINMVETFTRAQWRLEDGTLYEWPANEHCMVLVGYDEDVYYFNDPYTGTRVAYKRILSEERYNALGQQALVITE